MRIRTFQVDGTGIQTFQVDGMTCGHCVGAVTAELTEIAPGASIAVVLGSDGPSTVTMDGAVPLTDEQIAAALDEAGGYTLHTGGETLHTGGETLHTGGETLHTGGAG